MPIIGFSLMLYQTTARTVLHNFYPLPWRRLHNLLYILAGTSKAQLIDLSPSGELPTGSPVDKKGSIVLGKRRTISATEEVDRHNEE